MARSGLRYRQALRAFRSESALFQGAAVMTALSLLAGITAAATVGSSGASHTRVASPDRGGAQSPGDEPAGHTTGLESAGPKTSTAASGALGTGGTATPPGASNVSQQNTLTNPGPRVPINAAVAKALCGGPAASGTLTASDQGVTATSIKVAFPYFDPTAAFALTGTTDNQPANQPAFIQAYVDCINAAGGIDGRQINPIIQVFNPLDENLMHALCLKWATEDKVFAVLDSASWYGDNELCLTQDYHIPLVTGEATATEFGTPGRPYLWWTEPAADQSIDNLVLWAKQTGHLTPDMRIGVVTSDRPQDQDALKHHLLPDLRSAGLPPADVETFTYDRSQAEAQATLAVNKMITHGVKVVLPLLTFDSFAFWLQAAENQDFYPTYLLSDYEAEVVEAQALLGDRYPKSLNHTVAPHYGHLGEVDKSPSTYSADEQRCVKIWKTEHPASATTKADVTMRWCDSINVFVEAARRAGATLTRLRWAQEMGTIEHFGAAMTPELSFSQTKFFGPTQMKVVEILTSNCPPQYPPASGSNTCVVPVSPYEPIRRFG